MIWIAKAADRVWTWSLKFLDSEADESFKEEFSKALYETNMKIPFNKVSVSESLYIRGIFTASTFF